MKLDRLLGTDNLPELKAALLELYERALNAERELVELQTELEQRADSKTATQPDKTSVVLATARDEWSRHIEEPPGPNFGRIDEYIRGDQGLQWTWVDEYEKDGQFAWCGAFAAFCFGAAGLRADIRKNVMSSCYRIHKWARDTPRLIAPVDIQTGDIVIVGSSRSKRWGAHVTICTKRHELGVDTIEGNARGLGFGGQRYEGVVKQSRPWSSTKAREYRVFYGVRPLPEDYRGRAPYYLGIDPLTGIGRKLGSS